MSATMTKPAKGDRPRLTRDQAADRLLEMLNEEPQSMASLRRRIQGDDAKDGTEGVVRSGLNILKTRGSAKYIEHQGWVLAASAHQETLAQPQHIEPPYEVKKVRLDEMVIDESYQRPLTTFWQRIYREFNPYLMGALSVSDRGARAKPRYAIMDGQTRWHAARQLGIVQWTAFVYTGLTPEEEAGIFAKLQTERRGMLAWHRFRAQLKEGQPRAVAINTMVKGAGFKLGIGEGYLSPIGTLEKAHDINAFLLERTLVDLHEAWPDQIPEAPHIKGLHYLFRRYPLPPPGQRIPRNHKVEDIDDERLVNRLRAAGMRGLLRKADAARDMHPTGKGASEIFTAHAIQSLYMGGGRS